MISKLSQAPRSMMTCLATLVLLVFVTPLAGAQTTINPSFTLSDPEGKPVTDVTFRGKWLLIYFGYTHCADLCPTELADMVDALRQMGAEATRVQPIFVTIDPARDNGSYLRDYVSQFDNRLVGLGGTPEQVSAAATGFGVTFVRIPRDDGSYSFKHSSKIFVIDPDGHYDVTFSHMSDPYMIASKMLELISAEPSLSAAQEAPASRQ